MYACFGPILLMGPNISKRSLFSHECKYSLPPLPFPSPHSHDVWMLGMHATFCREIFSLSNLCIFSSIYVFILLHIYLIYSNSIYLAINIYMHVHLSTIHFFFYISILSLSVVFVSTFVSISLRLWYMLPCWGTMTCSVIIRLVNTRLSKQILWRKVYKM